MNPLCFNQFRRQGGTPLAPVCGRRGLLPSACAECVAPQRIKHELLLNVCFVEGEAENES